MLISSPQLEEETLRMLREHVAAAERVSRTMDEQVNSPKRSLLAPDLTRRAASQAAEAKRMLNENFQAVVAELDRSELELKRLELERKSNPREVSSPTR